MSIVELRQYTLRPGARETLIELFEREFVTGQQAAGITMGAGSATSTTRTASSGFARSPT
ncbi:hypothetical protein ABT263_17845 [Kitasatospora sp. NPDC001603]|uniref:hypothetical protein n=1 Tax=Kitasatospora sp. NPDC001603 TaxID=3154388 RepID=UPI003323D4DE